MEIWEMMAEIELDLRAVPLIDGHCHSIAANFLESSVESFLRIFTEADDDRFIARHLPHTLTYRRAIRDLAAFLDCSPTPAAILEVRRRRPDYLSVLCHDAGLQGLLIDRGYPPGTLRLAELEARCGCRVGEVLRLETLAEELLLTAPDFASFEQCFREALQAAKRRGAVALKSIVAYRSGLAVQAVPSSAARQTFQQLKARAEQQGPIRLAAKPLLDYCVGIALEEAARLELPVQFHTGFGDPDIDILTANPALLRPIFADPRYAGVPIVLLHMGYPYVRESAFLSSLYSTVYVDLSLAVPLLCPLLPHLLQELLALAPVTKILYGSDGHSHPEMLWLGARYARWSLGEVLGRWIGDGTLTEPEALYIAERICYRNTLELYRLDSSWLQGKGPPLSTSRSS
jgi:predicted TIM-barrel fold metal-dependent hydrolase